MTSDEQQGHASHDGRTSPSAVTVDPPKVNDYTSFAEAYTSENETNLINAHYERPAMLALAGDVAGRRILDAGCGAGALSAALRDRGALVSGFDASSGMLELARRRLGEGADLRVADLGSPFPTPTTRSTTSSRPWCCTTWRTGGRRWPSCGACSSPAGG